MISEALILLRWIAELELENWFVFNDRSVASEAEIVGKLKGVR